MKYLSLFLGLLLLLSWRQSALALDCHNMTGPQTLLECTLAKHPLMVNALGLQQSALAGLVRADQSPNPRFELYAEDIGGDALRQEAAFVHPLELGGAKSARRHKAQAEQELAKANTQLQRTQVVLQITQDLYRLSQLQIEVAQLKENITTFSNLLQRFSKTRGLNPEQRVSLSAYQFALQESQLMAYDLKQERKVILSRFQAIHGLDFRLGDDLLPAATIVWPRIKHAPLQSPELKQAQAEVSYAQGLLQVEEAKAWGTLELAPRIIQETRNNLRKNSIAFGLNIPLPLYQSNAGGKQQAQAKLDTNQQLAQQKAQELAARFKQKKESYQQVLRQLKDLLTPEEFRKKHKEIHQAMRRGSLPAPLVIEVHRQFLTLLKQRHQLELYGLAQLIQIKSLQGNLKEFQLP